MSAKAPLFREPAFNEDAFLERRAWVASVCYVVIILLALLLMIGFYVSQDMPAVDEVLNPTLSEYNDIKKYNPICECQVATAQYADFVTFAGNQVPDCSYDAVKTMTSRETALGGTPNVEAIALKAKMLTAIEGFINDTCKVARLVKTQAEFAVLGYTFISTTLLSQDYLQQQFKVAADNSITGVTGTLDSFMEFGRVMNAVNAPSSISNLYGNTDLFDTSLGQLLSSQYPAKHQVRSGAAFEATKASNVYWLRLANARDATAVTSNEVLSALETDLAALLRSSSRSHLMNVVSAEQSLFVKFRMESFDSFPTATQYRVFKFTNLRGMWPNSTEAALIYCDDLVAAAIKDPVPTGRNPLPVVFSIPMQLNVPVTALTAGNRIQSKYFQEAIQRGVAAVVELDSDRVAFAPTSPTAVGAGSSEIVLFMPNIQKTTAAALRTKLAASTALPTVIAEAIANLGSTQTTVTLTFPTTYRELELNRKLLQFSPTLSPATSRPGDVTQVLQVFLIGLNDTAVRATNPSTTLSVATELFQDVLTFWPGTNFGNNPGPISSSFYGTVAVTYDQSNQRHRFDFFVYVAAVNVTSARAQASSGSFSLSRTMSGLFSAGWVPSNGSPPSSATANLIDGPTTAPSPAPSTLPPAPSTLPPTASQTPVPVPAGPIRIKVKVSNVVLDVVLASDLTSRTTLQNNVASDIRDIMISYLSSGGSTTGPFTVSPVKDFMFEDKSYGVVVSITGLSQSSSYSATSPFYSSIQLNSTTATYRKMSGNSNVQVTTAAYSSSGYGVTLMGDNEPLPMDLTMPPTQAPVAALAYDKNAQTEVIQNLRGAETPVDALDCTLNFNQITKSTWGVTKGLNVGCTPYSAVRNNRVYKVLLLDKPITVFDQWGNLEQAFRNAYIPDLSLDPTQNYCDADQVKLNTSTRCSLETAKENGYVDYRTLPATSTRPGWARSLDYTKYFNKCKPKSCTYTHIRRRNGPEVVVIIAGLLGGFNTALTVVISAIGGIVYSMHKKKMEKEREEKEVLNVENKETKAQPESVTGPTEPTSEPTVVTTGATAPQAASNAPTS
jgi:hypothetical protein